MGGKRGDWGEGADEIPVRRSQLSSGYTPWKRGREPFHSLAHQSIPILFGSSSSFDSHDLSGLDLEKEEKEKWEQHVKALGDQLVKDLGLLEGKDKSQMVLRDLQWRGIQKIGKQGEWMNDGEYGIKLFYEKQAGHVPIVHSPVGQGENGRSEYLTLSYTKEGTLLEVKHIGSMEVKGKESGEESREESGFLLPF